MLRLKVYTTLAGIPSRSGFRLGISIRGFSSCSASKEASPAGSPCQKGNYNSNIKVKWFYATDSPISKPDWHEYVKDSDPEKFIPFSDYDSSRLEQSYQKLYRKQNSKNGPITEKTTQNKSQSSEEARGITDIGNDLSIGAEEAVGTASTGATKSEEPKEGVLVPVNEDKLFQVDLKKFQLSPVYWEGPVYEVRRGTWFTSSGVPLSNELSQAIELGYHSKKPYNFDREEKDAKASKTNKDKVNAFNKLKHKNTSIEIDLDTEDDLLDLQNGSLIMYYDEKNAAIFPKSKDSKFQIGVIRNFGPSKVTLLQVEYIQRGFTDDLDKTIFDNLPSNPIPSLADTFRDEVAELFKNDDSKSKDAIKAKLEEENSASSMESDFDLETSASKSDRPIDHLVLCVHGIGQILGNKYESVNFTHSINVLRNTMRDVYENNEELRKLNSSEKAEGNSNRIQVLPISWRHRIDFHPQRAFKKKENLPTLAQLTVDGVKPLRNLVGDVVLDILLYYEPRYIEQVFSAVTEELNRVYSLYKEKNPDFNGKVHVMGHSLGSAISFDILANQTETKEGTKEVKNKLKFDVENLFCVGSPIGVFKLLEQTGIGPVQSKPAENDEDSDSKSSIATPKCKNVYNVFHPCDPVGYRMEPLISTKFADFKPEQIPFAVKGLNTQFEELASIGDEISDKISKASSWFSKQGSKVKSSGGSGSSEEKRISKENALGDILSSLTSSTKVDPAKESKKKNFQLEGEDLELLTSLNSSGRVDYCLPQGVFDISILSAISAHVSYFEDVNTAGFMVKEILTKREKVESKTVIAV